MKWKLDEKIEYIFFFWQENRAYILHFNYKKKKKLYGGTGYSRSRILQNDRA